MEQTLQVLVAQLLQLFLYLNFLAGNLIEFILDQFGSLGPEALPLLKDIQAEALFCSGSPNPLRLTRSSFLHQLSCLWQFENARIVVQWLTMARDKHVRHIVFS